MPQGRFLVALVTVAKLLKQPSTNTTVWQSTILLRCCGDIWLMWCWPYWGLGHNSGKRSVTWTLMVSLAQSLTHHKLLFCYYWVCLSKRGCALSKFISGEESEFAPGAEIISDNLTWVFQYGLQLYLFPQSAEEMNTISGSEWVRYHYHSCMSDTTPDQKGETPPQLGLSFPTELELW